MGAKTQAEIERLKALIAETEAWAPVMKRGGPSQRVRDMTLRVLRAQLAELEGK